jgi:hypothetical protein
MEKQGWDLWSFVGSHKWKHGERNVFALTDEPSTYCMAGLWVYSCSTSCLLYIGIIFGPNFSRLEFAWWAVRRLLPTTSPLQANGWKRCSFVRVKYLSSLESIIYGIMYVFDLHFVFLVFFFGFFWFFFFFVWNCWRFVNWCALLWVDLSIPNRSCT